MKKKSIKKKHHESESHKHYSHTARKHTNYWKTTTIVLILILAGVLLFGKRAQNSDELSQSDVANNTLKFINTYMLQGSTASLLSVNEENGLYRVRFSIQGKEYDSFVTANGEFIFPQGINITDTEEKAAQAQNGAKQNTEKQNVPTSDVPKIELFVMSHCPYGTQMEKGLLPVLKLFGNKVDFNLKFVYYSMHGEKELQEQMKQYCIQKETPELLTTYLACFLKAGDTVTCLNETGVDTAALTTCVADVNEKYNIMSDYKDKSTWVGNYPSFSVYLDDNKKYGVGGSPTLVVNGVSVPAGRSPSALQAIICSAFSSKPEECNTALSTTTPGPGFGFASTGSSSTAECG